MKKTISIKIFIITILLIIICFVCVMWLLLNLSNSKKIDYSVVSVGYKEHMGDFSVENFSGNNFDILPLKEMPTVVFYLSDTCGTCVEVLKNFNRIKSIFGTKNLNYILLWDDNIPKKLVDKYEIDREYCYGMKGDTKIVTPTPTFYILNEKGKVEYYNIDAQLFIEKLIKLGIIDNETLVENANDYIINHFLSEKSKKYQLIYFIMEGCPDCAEVEPIIEDDRLVDKYDITKIYKYDDVDASHIKDAYGIFKQIYKISWYPSFLILDKSKNIIIGETSVEELMSTLLKY